MSTVCATRCISCYNDSRKSGRFCILANSSKISLVFWITSLWYGGITNVCKKEISNLILKVSIRKILTICEHVLQFLLLLPESDVTQFTILLRD